MLGISVFVCFALALSAVCEGSSYDMNNVENHFQEFTETYDKQYDTVHERQYRLEIFKQNLKEINKLNQGGGTVFGITKFCDLTPKEFKQTMLGLKLSSGSCSPSPAVNDSAPSSFDWRSRGAVSPVKDQSKCGACWAFSAAGNIEGQYAIKYNRIVSMSAQQLVDCDKDDRGCIGGLMEKGFSALINMGGMMSEEDYPYVAKDSECAFSKDKVVATITDCNSYEVDEDQMTSTLYSVGPLSISIDATVLQYYTNGVIAGKDCVGKILNHGILLVGYGVDNGVSYWLLKNSWASTWGEDGYFRIERGCNACKIMDENPSSSVVA